MNQIFLLIQLFIFKANTYIGILSDIVKGINDFIHTVTRIGFLPHALFAGLADVFGGAAIGLVNIMKLLLRLMTGEIFLGLYSDLIKVTDPENAFFGVWSVADTINSAILTFGLGLLIVFWFVDLIDKSTKEQLSAREFVRSFLMFIITAYVMENNMVIMGFCVDTAAELFDTVSVSLLQKDGGIKDIVDKITVEIVGQMLPKGEDMYKAALGEITLPSMQFDIMSAEFKNWGTLLGDYASQALIWMGFDLKMILLIIVLIGAALMSCFIYLYMTSQFIARGIQLTIYAAFTPIAIADIYQNGYMNSSGMRFVKKFFAIALQGLILYAIILFGQLFLVFSLGENASTAAAISKGLGDYALGGLDITFKFLVFCIATNLALFSLAGRSQQMANDIVGV